MRVLITGGAGFVGANLAVSLAARHPDWEIVSFDNLRRRGAELNLARLRDAGVSFVHGDVRELSDLETAGEIQALVECSAEPSVLAGLDGGLDYLVRTNLLGAYHCLELARRHRAQVVFLSTSRVYPVAALNRIVLREGATRFEPAPEQPIRGVSPEGVSEDFPLDGARTPYGATKLAAELLIAEFADAFGVSAVIDRCGVIAGPWQMGKVDQGVFAYWLLAHYFDLPLEYIGFGGTGKQVRDVLHVADLVDLIDEQLMQPEQWRGVTANVGGGRSSSLSLREATELCRELTGRTVEIPAAAKDRPGDVPYYVSDCRELFNRTAWRPRRNPRSLLVDMLSWLEQHEGVVAAALGASRPARR